MKFLFSLLAIIVLFFLDANIVFASPYDSNASESSHIYLPLTFNPFFVNNLPNDLAVDRIQLKYGNLQIKSDYCPVAQLPTFRIQVNTIRPPFRLEDSVYFSSQPLVGDTSGLITFNTHGWLGSDINGRRFNLAFVTQGCDYSNFSLDIYDSLQTSDYVGKWGTQNTDYTPTVLFNGPYVGKVPVLIVPGVMGTDLVKDNERLWLDLHQNLLDIGDEFMDPLQFTSSLKPSDISVNAGSVINKEVLSSFTYDYTGGLINEFRDQGYAENETIFTFPYDWRYGVSGDMPDGKKVTDLLAQKIQDIIAQTGSDKVDIVAHSTGGLLVKKYVMDHQSDHHIGKAVFVGVPNLGAPKAFKVLLNGDNFGIPFLDDDEMKKIAQNLPVVYDLAPSGEYYARAGSFMTQSSPWTSLLPEANKDLNYSEAISELTDHDLINRQALAQAQNLHTTEFDNFDVRTAGVDVYNVVGCKTATFGKFIEKRQDGLAPSFKFPTLTSGDGTVPFVSANTIPTNSGNTFFAPKADHGKMPSALGIRQEIVSLLSGHAIDEQGKILLDETVRQNPELCQIKGELLQVNKWADIEVADQNNNVIKLEGLNLENTIPGADFEIWEKDQFVFLPTDENQTYTIRLKGNQEGSLTVIDKTMEGDTVTKSQVFTNIPSSSQFVGSFYIGGAASMDIDTDGDGSINQTVAPTTVLTGERVYDTVEPSTTPVIVGTPGSGGNFVGDVTVTLPAVDPILSSSPSETSGVAVTYYNLDGQGFVEYTEPIIVTAPGQHTIEYYSVDNAGNQEPAQTVTFTISDATVEPPVPDATSTPPSIDPTSGDSGQTSTSTPPSSGNETSGSGGTTAFPPSGSGGGGIVFAPVSSNIASVTPQVLGAATELHKHPEGTLIKSLNDPTVYLITGGSKHPFTSAKVFLRLGYKFRNVQLAWPGDDEYLLGMPVTN